MQAYPPSPPDFILTTITTGLIVIVIYVYVRLTKDGESRLKACQTVLVLGTVGMVIVAISITVYAGIWTEIVNEMIYPGHIEPTGPFTLMFVSMAFTFPFILVMLLDQSNQKHQLREIKKPFK